MMSISKFHILFFSISIFIFSSCYTPRYVYSPAAHNVPVLTQKGDSKLAGGLSANLFANTNAGGFARGFDLQAAYATGNHLAVMVNYFHRKERNGGNFDAGYRDSSVIRYKRNLTELGIGWYTMLGSSELAAFQVFAGIGTGQFSFTDDGHDAGMNYYSRFHKAKITKYFLQPAVMVRSPKNFVASLSSRFSLISFHHINSNYTAAELDNYKLDSLAYSPHLFWEPAVINSFGFNQLPGIRFEFQAGFSFLTSRLFIDARSFNFSASIILDVPALLKRKTPVSKKQD